MRFLVMEVNDNVHNKIRRELYFYVVQDRKTGSKHLVTFKIDNEDQIKLICSITASAGKIIRG